MKRSLKKVMTLMMEFRDFYTLFIAGVGGLIALILSICMPSSVFVLTFTFLFVSLLPAYNCIIDVMSDEEYLYSTLPVKKADSMSTKYLLSAVLPVIPIFILLVSFMIWSIFDHDRALLLPEVGVSIIVAYNLNLITAGVFYKLFELVNANLKHKRKSGCFWIPITIGVVLLAITTVICLTVFKAQIIGSDAKTGVAIMIIIFTPIIYGTLWGKMKIVYEFIDMMYESSQHESDTDSSKDVENEDN